MNAPQQFPASDVASNELRTSSQCLVIARADKAGTLSLIEREGRFGSFIAICDDRGTIEVADTRAEASERIAAIRARMA